MTEISVKKTVPDPEHMVLVQAKIPEPLSHWINQNFPHGFKQDFIHTCFFRLHELIEASELPHMEVYTSTVISGIVERAKQTVND